MKQVILIFLVTLLLSGCAKYGPMYELPPVSDADAAELVIIRKSAFVASGAAMSAVIDGIHVFALESGGYTILRVSPAPHTVSAVFPFSSSANTRDNIIKVTPAPRERLYFLVEPDNIFTFTVSVKSISMEQGEELIKKSKFQPNY